MNKTFRAFLLGTLIIFAVSAHAQSKTENADAESILEEIVAKAENGSVTKERQALIYQIHVLLSTFISMTCFRMSDSTDAEVKAEVVKYIKEGIGELFIKAYDLGASKDQLSALIDKHLGDELKYMLKNVRESRAIQKKSENP